MLNHAFLLERPHRSQRHLVGNSTHGIIYVVRCSIVAWWIALSTKIPAAYLVTQSHGLRVLSWRLGPKVVNFALSSH
jgi:hypothetical protein